MEDHDFQVVRKNLNILSVLILILAYTNAQIEEINFLGIDMRLSGIKLYQALFIGYLYFVWRFLTKLPLRGGFWNDFMKHYLESSEGVRDKHNYDRYKEQLVDKSERLAKAINTNDPNFHLIQLNFIRFSDWPITKLRMSVQFQASKRESMELPQFNVDYDIKVSRLLVIRKLIHFCIKYDKFGDYLFPLVPVFINLGYFLFDRNWQGGIYKML